MKKSIKMKISLISIAVTLILGGIYYYLALPAINIHSEGFWGFIILLFIILTITSAVMQRKKFHEVQHADKKLHLLKILKQSKLTYGLSILTACLIAVFLIGSILSSPIVNAKQYQKLIHISDGDFKEDIKQISYNEIPLLDRDSASLLGSRKMGSMVEYVSQFEVSEHYSQINYNNRPVRVTPLRYGNLFKWLSNRRSGIPAYMKIDMATQKVECVKLSKGIKYTDAEHFGRYIYRYLRLRFPTYIFDHINFEIDEDGIPYWICPAISYKIGLFGGRTIKNTVIVNAVTGEYKNYKVEDVPTWVDRVYSSELLISYYDYYGSLKHGYLNTLFSQKDCLQTTEGYNYIALNDDVWMYTGVTSVGGDESLVGFILCNQRTAETKYYSVSGAKEYSAMQSAEGKVQNLGYNATFPLLLNVANEPTYILTLKDSAGLVKKYAMINIEQYTVVATGDTITECENNYITQLKNSNLVNKDSEVSGNASGVISKIAQVVIDGNTHYYVMLEGYKEIFDFNVSEKIRIIQYDIGDSIAFQYIQGGDVCKVTELNS
ncbi:hypothetical protein [[Clostridium] polysaccharolyticum]|uniref:CvpA family protein n=1 Tax=[Clostridium] polysaccharolyticum TaxID=29364 RepID=A0A1I0ADM6_9FIRM|nr:hypothetical protein [[Clostridium] polysaccharolyticum]SES92185.1 hypothetical protein SAMN04487772_10594 [[Clostridium] polysaccharolyticum]